MTGTDVVQRDNRTGWSLISGPAGDRWVRDRDRLGWGQDRAYSRWKPSDEAAYLRGVVRADSVEAAWSQGGLTSVLDGGKASRG
jgi:hypothetical protein